MKEQWQKLKEWWSNLAARERKALFIGSFVSFSFIVYQFIWQPYINQVALMRERIQKNQTLLAWMQNADKKIQQLEKKSQVQTQVTSPVVLLGKLQKQIHQARLDDTLTPLKQANNDAVELHFRKVEFDKFITLFASIVKNDGVMINQLTITALNSPGDVDVDAVLGTK